MSKEESVLVTVSCPSGYTLVYNLYEIMRHKGTVYADSDVVNDSGYHRDYESVTLVRWKLNITLLICCGNMPYSLYEARRGVRAEKCVFQGLCDRVGDVGRICNSHKLIVDSNQQLQNIDSIIISH